MTRAVGDTPRTHEEMLAVLQQELSEASRKVTGDVPTDQALHAELGIDSLDLVVFVASVEYRFGLVVPDEDWQRLPTLDAIASYALARLRR